MSYINIQGRGLKFNQGALIIFQSKIDQDNIGATAGYALIYAGLKSNAYVKGEEFTETFEQVCDWVDTLSDEEILNTTNCFKETQAYKKIMPEAKEDPVEDDKKKLTTEPIASELPVDT